jgi:8-oxo-dGTP pyrophosphatase MutT (NUDIX family)
MANPMRDKIVKVVAAIEPLDEIEREHRDSTIEWIRSGAPIFRTVKPDVPPRHLVSYFALVDEARGKMLLVDHKIAGLWLPSGGHVEPDEDPRATVIRELAEELSLAADFMQPGPLVHHGDAGRRRHRAYRRVALVFAARRQLARDRIRSRRVSRRAMVWV